MASDGGAQDADSPAVCTVRATPPSATLPGHLRGRLMVRDK